MKKQRMERLDDKLFQPLTADESLVPVGGGTAVTNFISFIPTGGDGPSSDVIRDAG